MTAPSGSYARFTVFSYSGDTHPERALSTFMVMIILKNVFIGPPRVVISMQKKF
jgi:hypothetical protein